MLCLPALDAYNGDTLPKAVVSFRPRGGSTGCPFRQGSRFPAVELSVENVILREGFAKVRAVQDVQTKILWTNGDPRNPMPRMRDNATPVVGEADQYRGLLGCTLPPSTMLHVDLMEICASDEVEG
jgi:hypothetical protein